jgi:c-di-GMP-binding flagellar brake protein YcgR
MDRNEPLRLPPLESGTPVRLSLGGAKEQLPCTLAGSQEDEFLIIRLPVNAGLVWRMAEGDSVTVRLFSSGAVYGFVSGVAGRYSKGPLRFLFLTYPKSVEAINLRQEKRIQCYLPAQVVAGDQKIKGIVSDLSSGGVRFTHRLDEDQELTPMNLGDLVNLRCSLLGVEGMQTQRCQIRNLNWDSSRLELGLAFQNTEGHIAESIRQYVDSVWDFIEEEKESENKNR